MTDDMKKDRFLSNESANELSRQLTEWRFKHSRVKLDNVSHDPDLARLAATITQSQKKRKTAGTGISEDLLKKLANSEGT